MHANKYKHGPYQLSNFRNRLLNESVFLENENVFAWKKQWPCVKCYDADEKM